MTDTEVNIPLLRKAVEWAEAEAAKPEELCEWVQGTWVVPTRAAFDAWEGATFDTLDEGKAQACGTCYCIAGFAVATTLGPMYAGGIQSEAQRVLRLRIDQAKALFAGENTIADVRRIAEAIAGERL